MIIYRSNTGKKIEQLPFRIELIEGLFVKYASVVEHKVPGPTFVRQHSAAANRKTFYKQDSSNRKESKTAKTVCCVSDAWEEEGHCVLV
jgi:hypothetical protein